jgi:DnaK suppressor protein
MSQEECITPATTARILAVRTRGPHWRTLLEARWRARLQEVTELSLAYHRADAAAPDGGDAMADSQEAQRLLSRAVAARQKLADVDEALARLAAGTFGYCEQCLAEIPAGLLAAAPERRYCPDCAGEPGAAQRHAVAP